MTPTYDDGFLTIYGGDCRAVLAELPAASVHCVVTSPPYWGLRDYGTATWDGGDPACGHVEKNARNDVSAADLARRAASYATGTGAGSDVSPMQFKGACPKCGARRIDSQLGLEPTPEEYVANMVAVFREVRRVLRDDGTLWLNLGDSYANDGKWGGSTGGKHVTALHGPGAEAPLLPGTAGSARGLGRGKRDTGLKPKDLVGIPWRVAFALQADGWYLRSDIIWSKPNPMPESVTDRPTKAHEYLFLLSKSPRYFFDADAVREGYVNGIDAAKPWAANGGVRNVGGRTDGLTRGTAPEWEPGNAGRNLRTVWTIATEPYPGAHFATFPRKLVEPCVKAGTSERGVCPECGAPWERVVERERVILTGSGGPSLANGHGADGRSSARANLNVTTTGWRPSCAHTAEPVPAVVLDPFAGSGTTLLVAQALGRKAVGIDLNPEYLRQALRRASRSFGVGGKALEDDGSTRAPEGSLWEDVR